jgi:hypothetical protein
LSGVREVPDSTEISKHPIKLYPTLGCCGLDCGLCPRYYTVGTSKCPGCCAPDFFNKHPSCPFITCCVKKNKLEVCSLCNEFPCPRFKGWDAGDSFVTHIKSISNLNFIKEHGLEKFMKQQKKRFELLETILKGFDDGRAKSFYCIAATMLPIANLEISLNEAGKEIRMGSNEPNDIKTRALILRKVLSNFADKEGIKLSLRKKEEPHGRG